MANVDTKSAIAERLAELARKHPRAREAAHAVQRREDSGADTLLFDARLRGELLVDAVVTARPGNGAAELTVLLGQHNGLKVLATGRYDSTTASFIAARSKARRLRAGVTVLVQGKGLRLDTHQGEKVLRVIDVQSIDPPHESAASSGRKDLE
jgi:hypothetical protein